MFYSMKTIFYFIFCFFWNSEFGLVSGLQSQNFTESELELLSSSVILNDTQKIVDEKEVISKSTGLFQELLGNNNVSDNLKLFLEEFSRSAPDMILALESRARGDFHTYAQKASLVFDGFIKKYKNLSKSEKLILFDTIPEIDAMLTDPNVVDFVHEFSGISSITPTLSILLFSFVMTIF